VTIDFSDEARLKAPKDKKRYCIAGCDPWYLNLFEQKVRKPYMFGKRWYYSTAFGGIKWNQRNGYGPGTGYSYFGRNNNQGRGLSFGKSKFKI